jgi:hypothetical protein
MHGA